LTWIQPLSSRIPFKQSFATTLVLALALIAGTNAGTVSMSLGHKQMGSGLKLDSVTGDFNIESQVTDDISISANVDNSDSPLKSVSANFKVSDDLSVGANVDNGSSLKSVFAKFATKFGGGDVNSDLTLDMTDNSISGDITYSEGGNTLKAAVDSNSADLVNSVEYSRSGAGWSFKPTFNLQDKSVALDASCDYSADTSLSVSVGASGDSTLTVDHKLDSSTGVNVQMSGADINSAVVEVTREIDSANSVKPRFDVASKKLTASWVRKLDNGRTLNVAVDPENSVGLEVEGSGAEDWTASVSAPWGDFGNADVSVGRKFNF